MFRNSEVFKPHANLDSAINRAICESDLEGGVALSDLSVGAAVEVQTRDTLYRIENCGEGRVLIAGHPVYCPVPVLVDFHGSSWGTPMIKVAFIGRGMKMEFRHPTYGLIRTSRVREIRELEPAEVLTH